MTGARALTNGIVVALFVGVLADGILSTLHLRLAPGEGILLSILAAVLAGGLSVVVMRICWDVS